MTGVGRVLGALTLVVALAASGCREGDAATPPHAAAATDEHKAIAAAERFLDRYVAADGRVVRHDEGGDTVSEGQAYALLAAAAIGDEARLDRVWSWTRDNLQRPDGLLSALWRDGRVIDREAATDADLDAAHALVLAATRFDRPPLRDAGARIAAAVLDHETVRTAAGGRLLVAGPWAVRGGIVNPSYFAPRAYAVLAATGRAGDWSDLREQARGTTEALSGATMLPPDWARADGATDRVRATGTPDGRDTTQRYGFDAVRVPIRMASACDRASRDLAARLWPLLAGTHEALLSRRLDGSPARGAVRHAVALVGAAGAARAAGHDADAERLLRAAAAQDRAAPTYYGAAWVALGRILLTTNLAGRCAPAR